MTGYHPDLLPILQGVPAFPHGFRKKLRTAAIYNIELQRDICYNKYDYTINYN